MSRIIYFSIAPVSWYLVIGLGGAWEVGFHSIFKLLYHLREKTCFLFFSSRLFIPSLLAVSLWVWHIICFPG